MVVQVLFFGATAAITAQRRVEIELAPKSNVADIFDKLIANHPLLAQQRLHFSVNQEYATGDEILNDGDELAIFTPVSGG